MVKANRTADALGRILPNVGGAKQNKRRLLATVVNNQLLYAAPIWAGALAFANNVEALERPQTKIALRCIMAYRTVSTAAALVVNGMIPAHLAALEIQKRFLYKKQSKIFEEAVERKIKIEKWQKEWTESKKGRWTARLIANIKPWMSRKFGDCDFHLTQMLTGHGCFGKYLERFKRRQSPECVDCGAEEDDAEHTLFVCDRWWQTRREVSVTLGADLEPDTIVSKMLESRENWALVKRYVKKVLSTKE